MHIKPANPCVNLLCISYETLPILETDTGVDRRVFEKSDWDRVSEPGEVAVGLLYKPLQAVLHSAVFGS